MKIIIKRVLLVIGILTSLIILFMIGYMLKAKSEIKTMTPLETQKITDNIYSIKDSFVNVYLVKSNGKYILFDAGNNIENIKNELDKLRINANEVKALFLTHTDRDHVASLSLFPEAEVYLSTQEEKLLTGETSRFLMFGNRINCDTYNLFNDNQQIEIDSITIRCILTPGHTPGSTCYLVNDKYLFTGDALSLIDGKVNEFNNFFNMDTETQRLSIEKISNLENVEYIFTAHHGMSNDFVSAFSSWINVN